MKEPQRMPTTTVEPDSVRGLDMVLVWAAVIVLVAAIVFVIGAAVST